MAKASSLRIALLQLTCEPGAVRENVDRATAQLARLGRASVDVVCLPELWSSGYCAREQFEALAEPVPGPVTELLSRYARDMATHLLFGMPERDGSTGILYNAAVWITPDGEVGAKYRKIHLATEREKSYFQPGDHRVTIDIDGLKAGLLVCYDLGYFPELARAYAMEGARLLFAPSAWGDSYSLTATEVERERLLAASAHRLRAGACARAFENGIFVVTCNRIGREYDAPRNEFVEFVGHSSIVAPDGVPVAELGGEEGVLVASIDLQALEAARGGPVDPLRDRRPELY